MSEIRTYDECYFLNYNQCSDLQLYEIGKQKCPSSYAFGPVMRRHYIFHYVFSGNGMLFLNNEQYKVSAHQGFVISPNVLAYYKASESDPWDYSWVHLDGPKIVELFQQSGMSVEQPLFMPANYSNKISFIMQELLENNNRELYCIGKIYELFDNIIYYSINSVHMEHNTKLSYIKKIISYINIKYSEPIRMDDIAHACGLDRSYMTRLFKEATGRTPQDYLMSYRMKSACTMLEKGNISIQNIAYSVGYSDYATFSKAFKRYIKVSPNEYRMKYQQK